MSELIASTNIWPADLPLPDIDYSGQVSNTTITSPAESGYIYRRSRSKKTYYALSVSFHFKVNQFREFKTFFYTDLGNGSASFKIPLRFPKNSELTDWTAQFAGGFEGSYEEGMWSVRTNLNLITPVVLPDVAPLLGYSEFLVVTDVSSGADSIGFETSDSLLFYVKS